MRTVAIIPAKGSSSGIPRKNLTMLCGKPLLAWTIEAAISATAIDEIIVSTDSDDVGALAREYDITVLHRPKMLAKPTVHALQVVIHAISALSLADDTAIHMLLPTSPCRTSADIDNAGNMLVGGGSVVGVTDSKPMHSLRGIRGGRLIPVVDPSPATLNQQRQDVGELHAVCGAIFLAHTSTLVRQRTYHVANSRPYYMPADRAIDVNTLADLQFAAMIMEGKCAQYS